MATIDLGHHGTHGPHGGGGHPEHADPNLPYHERYRAPGHYEDREHEFDAVFSNATLHWMPRAEDAARGIARALRPGGRFVAEFGGARCVQTVRNAVLAELAELGVEGHATPAWFFPTVVEYARILGDAGFFVNFTPCRILKIFAGIEPSAW